MRRATTWSSTSRRSRRTRCRSATGARHAVCSARSVRGGSLCGVRRAMALVAKMGGKVAKKYEVDVINMVPPGTEGSGRPGLIVYDYTYLFDCHGEGAMLACRPAAPP